MHLFGNDINLKFFNVGQAVLNLPAYHPPNLEHIIMEAS
jgi:hypothetical protein